MFTQERSIKTNRPAGHRKITILKVYQTVTCFAISLRKRKINNHENAQASCQFMAENTVSSIRAQ